MKSSQRRRRSVFESEIKNQAKCNISPIYDSDNDSDFAGFDANDIKDTIKFEEVIDLTMDFQVEKDVKMDSRSWSFEMVYQHFKTNFPKLAEVFLEQQIDGWALHLLTREDVLKLFGLTLGPALKAYQEISRIQKVSAPYRYR